MGDKEGAAPARAGHAHKMGVLALVDRDSGQMRSGMSCGVSMVRPSGLSSSEHSLASSLFWAANGTFSAEPAVGLSQTDLLPQLQPVGHFGL